MPIASTWSAVASRICGAAIIISGNADMLTTTREEWPKRDAEEPIAPLRLSLSCSSSVPREGVPALYTRRPHAPSLYFHRQGTTEVDPRRGAAPFDNRADHA